MSQQDVGDKLGITQRAYAFYEDGRRIPKWPRLQELGAILGISRKDLLAAYEGIEQNDTDDEGVGNSELKKVLTLMAEAYRDQAKAFAAQTEILKNIEKNMARQESQAKIETNLNEALAGIETLSVDSEKIMADLALLTAGRNGSSGDDDNK
ncbi:MAG: hypothetical protein BGO55_00795 [Sphingobacteriales bacterium 50-39]|nr:MAG: hypothetical protein BGO55_00795 [Sphingobacteriales bacterium 50-39]